MDQQFQTYSSADCPGIDNLASLAGDRNFPIIDTLLSIPFSLLHNLPRLCGIVPISTYQRELIAIGSEIIYLWTWDPPPSLITQSETIRAQNCAAKRQNDIQLPQPNPIHHPSRKNTTFKNRRSTLTSGAYTMPSSDSNLSQGEDSVEHPWHADPPRSDHRRNAGHGWARRRCYCWSCGLT
jgi:hypothetical protein